MARGVRQQSVIDLKVAKIAPAPGGFLLLTHRGPGVGVDHVGILDRFDGIMGEDPVLLTSKAGQVAFVGLVALRNAESQLETDQGGRLDPALRKVESVAHERDAQFSEITPEMLLERLQVRE